METVNSLEKKGKNHFMRFNTITYKINLQLSPDY